MKHICYFEIPFDNRERAQKFYSELFGWEFDEMTMGSTPYFSIKTPHGIPGGLLARRNPQQGPVNYVEVEALDDALEKAASLGATVAVEKITLPAMGHFALVRDTENNIIGLWESDPDAI